MNQQQNKPSPVSILRWLRLDINEAQRFLLLSIFIGIFAGLLVVCFHITIDVISWNTLGALSGKLRYGRLIAPTLGALVSAFLVQRIFRRARGSGVNQTKAAIYISDGYVPFDTVIGKFIACSTAIGTGNSLGPEDPSLQMGSGIASLLGRKLGLGRSSMRLIAPVGAAAGIAAAFNTPITGVLFVLEEVLAAWNASTVGSIVLSAVSAVVVTRWFLGDQPLFQVPAFEFVHTSELLVYALVGTVCGLLSALFIKLIRYSTTHLERLPEWRHLALPAASGFLIGVVGLWLPEVMGAGYEAIGSALHGRFIWQMLLLLGVAKLFVTLFCFSSGTPGGMFAPALFVGAMIGGGFGGLAQHVSSAPISSPESYMLVGMGTFFVGVFRAPMTSIFMVFEVSASYEIILPVMIANTVSYFVSTKLQPTPFFTLLAHQEGVDLPSANDRRAEQFLTVEDAMQPAQNFPLGEEAEQELLSSNVQLYPDMPLDSALRALAGKPVLAVVSRSESRHLLGVLTLADVHRAYGLEPDPVQQEMQSPQTAT